ncbi:MAG TPA: hypothetical protein VK817_19100 [Trebonia sp.]|jgi:hypothetical protein|nr:hypothetical protein [Trebonia sp.]
MSIAAIIVIVIVVVAIAVAGSVVLRRRALQRRFGPEYDRLAEEVGPRHAREELARRSRIVEQLEIRPLSQRQREEYDGRWAAVQEQFVDGPAQAARTAQTLITTVAREVGYSADDEERLFTELSVNHARALDGYRRGKDAASQPSGQSTEELRQALLEYRVLFRELLGEPDGQAAADPSAPAESALVTADVTAADATKE